MIPPGLRKPDAVRGFKDAALYVAGEISVFSRVLILLLFASLVIEPGKRLDPQSDPGRSFTFTVVAATVMLLVLWGIFRRKAGGASLKDLGYKFSRASIVAGVIMGIALNPWVEIQLSSIDERLFGPEAEFLGMREAGLLAALTMLFTNGFLAPIVEEYAWRGMIQNRFRRAWGAVWAIIATALLFSLKHFLGDLSFARTTQVMVFAFVVCIVASRWGTDASTITHVLANTASTLFWILDTFGVIQFY